MIRTQIQLEEQHLRQLKRIARAEGVSLAELIRRCVIRFLEEERPDRSALYARAAEIAGAFEDIEGKKDVALDHDRYLGEAFR
jgi:hypothetical protein